jgi:hypothetical protein
LHPSLVLYRKIFWNIGWSVLLNIRQKVLRDVCWTILWKERSSVRCDKLTGIPQSAILKKNGESDASGKDSISSHKNQSINVTIEMLCLRMGNCSNAHRPIGLWKYEIVQKSVAQMQNNQVHMEDGRGLRDGDGAERYRVVHGTDEGSRMKQRERET